MRQFELKRKFIKDQVNGGFEVVITKEYVLNKDKKNNRLWVMKPTDPAYINLRDKMKEVGQW